jgi:hypothetical protein
MSSLENTADISSPLRGVYNWIAFPLSDMTGEYLGYKDIIKFGYDKLDWLTKFWLEKEDFKETSHNEYT